MIYEGKLRSDLEGKFGYEGKGRALGWGKGMVWFVERDSSVLVKIIEFSFSGVYSFGVVKLGNKDEIFMEECGTI